MDLWVNPEEHNMENLYLALIKLGYPKEVVENIKSNRELENPTPIKLKDDNDLFKVDLMTNTFQKEFSWQECFDQSELITTEEVNIPVVHINQLIRMKENTNRLDNSMKDLVDAQELKKIRDLKMKNSQKVRRKRGRRL